jgi:ATP:corrinoid adenosyltransferase
MARLVHVYENLMIDVVQTNEKVARRALRILAEASGKSVSAAEHALRAAGHNMRVALVILKKGVDARKARKRLADARGDLRKALEEWRKGINAEGTENTEDTEKKKSKMAAFRPAWGRHRPLEKKAAAQLPQSKAPD